MKNEINNDLSGYKATLSRNVLLLLKPLVRILLRAGIGFANFAEWAKFAYVEVAEEDFTLDNRNQSTSRIAILTGLHRKEVARIRNGLKQEIPAFTAQPANRGERVVHAWLKEPGYTDETGAAKVIPLTGQGLSFEKIAQKASGDIHTTTVLDELLRINAVKIVDGNHLQLNTQAYIPEAHSNEQLDIFGQSVNDLISTLDHNINPESPKLRLQRTVSYHHLSPAVLDDFQQFSRHESEKLLLTLNDWLATHDLTPEEQKSAEIQYRAGIGIYYFAERNLDKQVLETGEQHD